MWVCGSLWPTRHGLLKVPRVKCWLMWPSTRHTTSSVVALVAGEVTHALEIGRLLCSTIPCCNHDTWQPFVGYHWGISHVSSIYPQLALSQESISSGPSALTLVAGYLQKLWSSSCMIWRSWCDGYMVKVAKQRSLSTVREKSWWKQWSWRFFDQRQLEMKCAEWGVDLQYGRYTVYGIYFFTYITCICALYVYSTVSSCIHLFIYSIIHRSMIYLYLSSRERFIHLAESWFHGQWTCDQRNSKKLISSPGCIYDILI